MEGGTPLHIRCINCHDKQLNCELHHQIKGSCYNCNVNGLQCLFSPTVTTRHLSSKTSDVSLFQRNCVHCTRSHLKCVFSGTFPSQCQRCSRLDIACLFKLSSQGRCSDLIARTDANDPNRCLVNASESVHCPHRNDVESCHARVCPVNVDDCGVCDNDQFHRSVCPPSWVHVFAKSNQPSSIRTQAASMAYIDQPVHKKARHRRNRRSRKKLRKHQRLLTEVVVPTSIQQNVLSESDIVDEVVVVGYGTQKKKEVTGAVSVLDSKAIEKLNPTRVEQALQGQIAGVNITSASGSPGSGSNIRIRGVSTNGDSSPLILVDGDVISDLSVLNPNDIKSINVLKDATAGIYGVRAANGVVLITTKTGRKESELKFQLDAYTGIQSTSKKIDLRKAVIYSEILRKQYF